MQSELSGLSFRTDLAHLRKQLEKVRQEQLSARDPLVSQLTGLVDSLKQNSHQLQNQIVQAVRSETSSQIKASLARYDCLAASVPFCLSEHCTKLGRVIEVELVLAPEAECGTWCMVKVPLGRYCSRFFLFLFFFFPFLSLRVPHKASWSHRHRIAPSLELSCSLHLWSEICT